MGITFASFLPVYSFLKDYQQGSRIATLGRQKLVLNAQQRSEVSNVIGMSSKEVFGDAIFLDEMPCFAHISFFSIDVSDYEGADIICDLNKSVVESGIDDKFDGIIDYGTLEHVFNVANALDNIFHMLKPGGRYHYNLPMSGCNGHGFYQFSPFFFVDFVRKNSSSLVLHKQMIIHERSMLIFDTFDSFCDLRRIEWNSLRQLGITGIIQRNVEAALNFNVFQSDYEEDWRFSREENLDSLAAYSSASAVKLGFDSKTFSSASRFDKLIARLKIFGFFETSRFYAYMISYRFNLPIQEFVVVRKRLNSLAKIAREFGI